MAKRKNKKLWVKAVPEANVREIDEYGRPLGGGVCRFVGKTWNADEENFIVDQAGTTVPYHPMYINRLKEKALLPMDVATAQLSGVIFTSEQK
jgi:hypothetical protein